MAETVRTPYDEEQDLLDKEHVELTERLFIEVERLEAQVKTCTSIHENVARKERARNEMIENEALPRLQGLRAKIQAIRNKLDKKDVAQPTTHKETKT